MWAKGQWDGESMCTLKVHAHSKAACLFMEHMGFSCTGF